MTAPEGRGSLSAEPVINSLREPRPSEAVMQSKILETEIEYRSLEDLL
jgi:hypothetical protein